MYYDWSRPQHSSQLAILLALILTACNAAFSQERTERTIDEIKTEAVHRAEVGQYPLIGLDPADVKEAFASIHTRDKDEWAAAFMGVADRYMNEAKSLEKTDPTKANADYIRAWRLYSFGRWPIPASPGKQRSYEKAIEAFLAHARFVDPPLEVVHIPFEGKEIIGHLRLPKNAKGPVPLVIAVNGLDSRKEDLAESFGAILPFGIGYLAVDGPETVISVDTYKSGVARAVGAGAEIVNDVSAFQWDPEMARTCADLQCGVVLMHTRGQPEEAQSSARAQDGGIGGA